MSIRHSLKLSLIAATIFMSTPLLAQETPQATITNGIINNGATTNGTMMAVQPILDDTAITAQIKSRILMDPIAQKTNINVTTTNGIVTLTGTADTDVQAGSVVEIAQSISGVKDVDTSNLNIKGSTQPLTDTFITAKVKGMFMQEKLFGDKDIAAMTIHVETKNGTVYLTGTADTLEQVTNAARIAKSVSGVQNVVSTVTVAGHTM